jgi:hypothetical protein
MHAKTEEFTTNNLAQLPEKIWITDLSNIYNNAIFYGIYVGISTEKIIVKQS